MNSGQTVVLPFRTVLLGRQRASYTPAMSDDLGDAVNDGTSEATAERPSDQAAEPAIVGTVQLTQKDVEKGIVEMSPLFRARRLIGGALALLVVAALVR